MKLIPSSKETERFRQHVAYIGSQYDKTHDDIMNFFRSNCYESNSYSMISYSEFGQDNAVIDLLAGKESSVFVDIGCGHPINSNNTYAFESMKKWSGVAFDPKQEWDSIWLASRANTKKFGGVKCRWSNNTKDITEYLSEFSYVDFLSLDIDGAENDVLYSILNLPYKPTVVVVEHDIYRHGAIHKVIETHKLLSYAGYRYIKSIGVDDIFVYANQLPSNSQFSNEYGYNIVDLLNLTF
jgi:hypothetical protein